MAVYKAIPWLTVHTLLLREYTGIYDCAEVNREYMSVALVKRGTSLILAKLGFLVQIKKNNASISVNRFKIFYEIT